MPLNIHSDNTIPFIRVSGIGSVRFEDLRDLALKLVEMGAIEVPRLIDLSDPTVRILPTEMRKYARYKEESLTSYKSVPVALIAANPSLLAVLRSYQNLVWGREPDVYIFPTLQEGMDWLKQVA